MRPFSSQSIATGLTINIDKGFRVEPFAAEPMINSPVAMDWDENGRIYVAEDTGYPLDTRPIGRIVLLEDTNGNGIPDRSTVFADHIVMPNGVMCWKGGVLVTAAPDVWFFKDTTGSGKADVREKVLTGFAFTNPQHMVNGPLYGPDNWIYLNHQGPIHTVVFQDRKSTRLNSSHSQISNAVFCLNKRHDVRDRLFLKPQHID